MGRHGHSHGRSHGHGHLTHHTHIPTHSFGHMHRHHHHHHYRGGGSANCDCCNCCDCCQFLGEALQLQSINDVIQTNSNTAISNNIFTFRGSETAAAQLQSSLIFQQPTNTGSATRILPAVFNQAELTIIGEKVESNKMCCFIICMVLGIFLIIPLFILLCDCFRNYIFPKYSADKKIYKTVGVFLRNAYQCTKLTLTVVDNTLNQQKCLLLRDSLQGTHLTEFKLINLACLSNYRQNEADNFEQNLVPIVALPIRSSFIWRDKQL